MRIRKKAVSPLIATVLLIAFAVALGAVVMNWGRSYVETTAEYAERGSDIQILCSRDINLKVVDGVENSLCYNDTEKQINFMLENAGTIDIEGLQVTVIGASDIDTTDLDNATIEIGHIKRFNVNYNNDTMGEILEIKFVPMIETTTTQTSVPCANSPLRKTDITECE
ncbi:hypothetical protein DRJ17_06545 [Candidatus Woesearchaeota archaeon]|nr:MAG: hypothetical protein DRJ17_06545 [Candidatus Woesearchaeota archaeon]